MNNKNHSERDIYDVLKNVEEVLVEISNDIKRNLTPAKVPDSFTTSYDDDRKDVGNFSFFCYKDPPIETDSDTAYLNGCITRSRIYHSCFVQGCGSILLNNGINFNKYADYNSFARATGLFPYIVELIKGIPCRIGEIVVIGDGFGYGRMYRVSDIDIVNNLLRLCRYNPNNPNIRYGNIYFKVGYDRFLDDGWIALM